MGDIRPTEAADLPAITAIYAQAVREGTASFEEQPPSIDEMTARWQTRQQGGYPDRVAVVDGRVVGYAYAGQYRPRTAYRLTVENSVYLDPAAQGQGLGKALMQAIIADCRARGFQQMIAVIGGKDNQASERLHLACGFRLVGRFIDVGLKFGQLHDTVLMQRDLRD